MIDRGDIVHTDDLLGCYIEILAIIAGSSGFVTISRHAVLVELSVSRTLSMETVPTRETNSTKGVNVSCVCCSPCILGTKNVDKCQGLVTDTKLEQPHGLDEGC